MVNWNGSCYDCKHYLVSDDSYPCIDCTHNHTDHFEARFSDSNENTEYDFVNKPYHYTQGGMETIEEMELLFGVGAVMDFCMCNAWKYRARASYKGNSEEDMKKSDWYIQKYKELSGRYGK